MFHYCANIYFLLEYMLLSHCVSFSGITVLCALGNDRSRISPKHAIKGYICGA